MPELLRSKKVTARKAHSCATCYAAAIQPGQSYQRDTYVYDGHVYDWVMCEACHSIASRVFAWPILNRDNPDITPRRRARGNPRSTTADARGASEGERHDRRP